MDISPDYSNRAQTILTVAPFGSWEHSQMVSLFTLYTVQYISRALPLWPYFYLCFESGCTESFAAYRKLSSF